MTFSLDGGGVSRGEGRAWTGAGAADSDGGASASGTVHWMLSQRLRASDSSGPTSSMVFQKDVASSASLKDLALSDGLGEGLGEGLAR